MAVRVMKMKEELDLHGFAIVEDILTELEISKLSQVIEESIQSQVSGKNGELFAMRKFFQQLPAALDILSSSQLPRLISEHFEGYFIVKSIYFDKPASSNWFVSYHQDLTIAVDRRSDIAGFDFWTSKGEHYAVRPPQAMLEDNFTVRLHLDNTTSANGALKVLPGSHLNGVLNSEDVLSFGDSEAVCEVRAGGAMFMKPLLMHSSGRTTNEERRRVIHIEFSRGSLPPPLNWTEKRSFAS